MERICPPIFITDQRTALGHTIAYAVLEFDIVQYLLHFAVQRCATDNEETQLTAERLVQTFFDLTADHFLQERRLPHDLSHRAADLRQYTFLHDLLNHQRYGQNHERFYLRKRFHKYRWGRSLREEINLCAITYLIQEFEHESEHMCDRQHRQHFVTRFVRNTLTCELYVSAQVQVRQHHTLWVAGRTARVIYHGYLVQVIGRELNISYFHSFRVGFGKCSICTFERLAELIVGFYDRHVVHENRSLQTLHLRRVDLLLYVRTYIQQYCLRMVH